MKKIIAIGLTLSLLFTLTFCAFPTKSRPKKEQSSNPPQEISAESSDPAPPVQASSKADGITRHSLSIMNKAQTLPPQTNLGETELILLEQAENATNETDWNEVSYLDGKLMRQREVDSIAAIGQNKKTGSELTVQYVQIPSVYPTEEIFGYRVLVDANIVFETPPQDFTSYFSAEWMSESEIYVQYYNFNAYMHYIIDVSDRTVNPVVFPPKSNDEKDAFTRHNIISFDPQTATYLASMDSNDETRGDGQYSQGPSRKIYYCDYRTGESTVVFEGSLNIYGSDTRPDLWVPTYQSEDNSVLTLGLSNAQNFNNLGENVAGALYRFEFETGTSAQIVVAEEDFLDRMMIYDGLAVFVNLDASISYLYDIEADKVIQATPGHFLTYVDGLLITETETGFTMSNVKTGETASATKNDSSANELYDFAAMFEAAKQNKK